MVLRLYNTLTRQKAEFKPIDPDNVRMYACGPTVYDYAHIGNARPVIVFDVLFRLLRHIYGPDHVTYVRNITDVDDKINARAARDFPNLPLNEAIRKVTTATEKQFHADIATLGVLPPTYEPRATEYIHNPAASTDMARLIEALVKRGYAYVAEDHVLFDVASMPDYGKLSNRSLDEMEAGARVEVAPYKKGPMDFVLWKPSKPGEPAWPSPCGIATPGRPGWHIECSAMSGALLGDVFDIHGGGIDLAFPHHENEIAQSRCAHGTPVMANVWMHNGFLQVEGEKMSKSLGNFVTINELLASDKFGGRPWHGAVLRFVMLQTHYRQPIDWTIEKLRRTRNELGAFRNAAGNPLVAARLAQQSAVDGGLDVDDELISALLDDLNTPAAISRLREMAKYASGGEDAGVRFLTAMKFLGLMDEVSIPYFSQVGPIADMSAGPVLRKHNSDQLFERVRVAQANGFSQTVSALQNEVSGWGLTLDIKGDGSLSILDSPSATKDQITALIAARLEARKRKDFAESDRIRDELASMGIALKDKKNKETGEIETTWEVIH